MFDKFVPIDTDVGKDKHFWKAQKPIKARHD
jgi:hypothetical protein